MKETDYKKQSTKAVLENTPHVRADLIPKIIIPPCPVRVVIPADVTIIESSDEEQIKDSTGHDDLGGDEVDKVDEGDAGGDEIKRINQLSEDAEDSDYVDSNISSNDEKVKKRNKKRHRSKDMTDKPETKRRKLSKKNTSNDEASDESDDNDNVEYYIRARTKSHRPIFLSNGHFNAVTDPVTTAKWLITTYLGIQDMSTTLGAAHYPNDVDMAYADSWRELRAEKEHVLETGVYDLGNSPRQG
jgi:hypothetical protein